ncbi:hypothetical protein ACFV7R_31015 [Streptomyces sp. NPDC059866]|uniref:hypothetical protein n=1 Tax=Streptomyces sp. NPDC059866 TaxID=3346978 RepID=UPI00365C21E6
METIRHGTGCSWLHVGIEAVGRSSGYELVVAEPCGGPDGVGGAIAATIEEYQPEAVVFVGVCCALDADLARATS